MLYQLTEHNGYWSQIINADIAKGRSPQTACNDVYRAILMMGRGLNEAMKVTQEAAYFSGVSNLVKF